MVAPPAIEACVRIFSIEDHLPKDKDEAQNMDIACLMVMAKMSGASAFAGYVILETKTINSDGISECFERSVKGAVTGAKRQRSATGRPGSPYQRFCKRDDIVAERD